METRNIDPAAPPLASGADTTVVVVGPGRSGTTMTVGALQRLGVEFGDGTDTLGEDQELNDLARAFVQRSILWRLPAARRRLHTALRERHQRWGSFGFKTPHLGRSLALTADLIENPVFVFVVRNPLHIARSWRNTHGYPVRKMLPRVILNQCATAAYLARTRRPVVTFSYEEAAAHPHVFVADLSAALGLGISEQARRSAADFIVPERGYGDARRFVGFVDQITDRKICGWITDMTQRDMAMTITVHAGGKRVCGGVANGLRADILAKGRHATGYCGFEQSFVRPLTAPERERITITIHAEGRDFQYGLGARGQLAILPSGSPLRDTAAATATAGAGVGAGPLRS